MYVTSHELEELLPLQLALESSAAATRTAGKYRRGTAIVALDAVVERTLVLAALRRGGSEGCEVRCATRSSEGAAWRRLAGGG